MIGRPLPDSGPFRWRLCPAPSDRLRLLAHRAVMAPVNAIGMRGGPRLSLLLQRIVGDYAAPLTAEAQPDLRLSFSGFDRYWMRVFFRGDLYEPELFRLFRRMRALRSMQFIDGGANIGFWSAVLTSQEFGIAKAVALEASDSTYGSLARTASLCDGRFATEHKALSREVGTVTFEQGVAHASRHIVRSDDAAHATSERVTIAATTIDDLVRRCELAPDRLLVKLDVEGAELDCVEGGKDAFDRGAIVIYEDHGKEPRSVLTAELLALGARCWFITDDGQLDEVTTAAEASRHKLERGRGYNFLCVSRAYDRVHPLNARLF